MLEINMGILSLFGVGYLRCVAFLSPIHGFSQPEQFLAYQLVSVTVMKELEE